jgi:hypothetical protein
VPFAGDFFSGADGDLARAAATLAEDVTSVTVSSPASGSVVSLPVYPVVQLNVGTDAAAVEIRSDVYAWDVCLDLGPSGNGNDAASTAQCFPVIPRPERVSELPPYGDLSPGSGPHVLKAYFFRPASASKGTPERRLAATQTTFSIRPSPLG